ncbi:TFIIB-type zinc ribbon-containing protein [Streptomyces umbrinus]
MFLDPSAPRALFSYDRDTYTATCRACRISETDLLPEEAGPWHAGHQGQCTGAPSHRPVATVLPFRRAAPAPAEADADPPTAPQHRAPDGRPDAVDSTSVCPECGTRMAPMEFDGFDFFHCPACGRRSFCSVEADDSDLPSFSQEEDGAVVVYHGTGDIDIETTAELASQTADDTAEGW